MLLANLTLQIRLAQSLTISESNKFSPFSNNTFLEKLLDTWYSNLFIYGTKLVTPVIVSIISRDEENNRSSIIVELAALAYFNAF